MPGSEQDQRSRRTFLRERLRSRARDRSTEKATVESGTTELTRLPGLETVEHAVVEPRETLEHGEFGRLMLFSGRSNLGLAERIAGQLGLELGDAELKTFTNGEIYCRYRESIRGADVFIVQSCFGPKVNDFLWELFEMVQAAKLASASRITAVMPWFPYSRQDKKSAPREPITAKLVADTLEAAGVDRVITMDLHAGQIQAFFTTPVDHMTALQLFAQYYRDKGFHGDGVVAVSPDPGRAKMAGKFAEMLEADLAIMKPANLNVLPVSVLLAETIQNVFSGESVSAIFAGENQLF